MIALLADGPVEIPLGSFLQYGSFGLLALLVFWAIFKFFPQALEVHRKIIEGIAVENKAALEKVSVEHKAALEKVATDTKVIITALVETFEKESSQCREERIATTTNDRELRKETTTILTKVLTHLESQS